MSKSPKPLSNRSGRRRAHFWLIFGFIYVPLIQFLLWDFLSVDQRISLGVGISNIVVVVLAIFGSQIQGYFFSSPELTLELANEGKGELLHIANGEDLRYYHLVVVNHRLNTVALNASVHWIAIEVFVNGIYETHTFPPIRMRWPYEGEGKIEHRQNIQTEQYVDLCLIDRSQVSLQVQREILSYRTTLLLNGQRKFKMHFEIRADNFTSEKPTVVSIDWNGLWSDDDLVMARNMVLSKAL